MKNGYEIRGEITAIFINSPKYGVKETLISTNKLNQVSDAVNNWTLSLNNKTKTFYVNGKLKDFDCRKTINLHRLIMGDPANKFIDHIDHDTLNNTDENLRKVSNQQNQQNQRGAKRNSVTGIRGVHWHKRCKKWEVQIRTNGKKMTIGYFANLKEAEVAAIGARKQFMPFSESDKAV